MEKGIRRRDVDEAFLSPGRKETLRLRRIQQEIIEQMQIQAKTFYSDQVEKTIESPQYLLESALHFSRTRVVSSDDVTLICRVPEGLQEEFDASRIRVIEHSAKQVIGTPIRLVCEPDSRF